MAKLTAPETVNEETEFPQSLEEFCTQLSTTDKRVELIGGFFSVEKAAGRIVATASVFLTRFQDFMTQPA